MNASALKLATTVMPQPENKFVGWVKEHSDGPTGTTLPKLLASQRPSWWTR